MANTYYARVTIQGTTTPQSVQVQAANSVEAKKLIEARSLRQSETLEQRPSSSVQATQLVSRLIVLAVSLAHANI